MINYILPLIFLALAVAGGFVAAQFFDLVFASAIRLAAEWERAVVFRLGKLSQVKGPGLFLVVPLVDQLRRIDTRVQTIQIVRQQVITKDNVPVSIDASWYPRVATPARTR